MAAALTNRCRVCCCNEVPSLSVLPRNLVTSGYEYSFSRSALEPLSNPPLFQRECLGNYLGRAISDGNYLCSRTRFIQLRTGISCNEDLEALLLVQDTG